MMRALDLFCGAGGATKGLQRAGFHVTGVDIKPQPRYCGDAFVQADAITPPFNLSDFDFIWASPPCQVHTVLKVMHNAKKHTDLIPAIRSLLNASGLPYAIENVFGAPLIPGKTIMLCGTMFDLRLADGTAELRRHRYFETNFPIVISPSCNHTSPIILSVHGGKVRDITAEKRHYAKDKTTRGIPVNIVLPQQRGFEVMAIDWMNGAELSQAIPPAYSEFIACAMLRNDAVAAQ